ncbi:MAG: hypothetical protein QME51_03620 [Planctomycetota bacterium]|nr:hypothetical protein [Planctomycetota bacterium]MDI6787439.1 hypothetical protein [Planctomycetota bacterium]
MRLLLVILCVICLIVSSGCGATPTTGQDSSLHSAGGGPSGQDDIIGKALGTKGLTRETARLDPQTLDTLLRQQVLVQSHFIRYWKNPWEFPNFVQSLTSQMIDTVTKPEMIYKMFMLSTARTGHRVTGYRQYAPEFKPKTENPLLEAIESLYKRCGLSCTETTKGEINKAISGIPKEVISATAKFIYSAGEARFYRDRALRHYPREKWQRAYDFATRSFSLDEEDEEFEDGSIINWDLGRTVDYDDLYTGAVPNLLAIMDMESFLTNPLSSEKLPEGKEPTKIDLSQIKFEFDTPLGKVLFNGKNEDNTYEGDKYLLIIDLAGNDTYKGGMGGSCGLEHPISTVIDWAGNDIYIADEKTSCAQGAGVFGYGFLIDNGGNDVFKAVKNAQGMCYFGVGFLIARGGDDVFEGKFSVQGSASFGIANLIKIDGNDKYYAYHTSQGFGFIMGFGALIDTAGNDRYIAEPYIIFRKAKQGHDEFRNYSFCQGAGWGQRGDLGGGHSMAGGTGVLQDWDGDDWYECGVYGQATGYWYATGILHDKAGNDHYEGSFYVQSGTAHMGLTMLLDEGGNDTYHTWKAISQAGAHDLSISFLTDKGGDNTFSAWSYLDEKGNQTLSDTGKAGASGTIFLGSAINQSIAVFISLDGNNTYNYYTKDCLGYSQHNGDKNSWRYDLFNIALFIDIGGRDTYNLQNIPPDWPEAGNNLRWRRINPKSGNPEKTFSFGIDTEKGTFPESLR